MKSFDEMFDEFIVRQAELALPYGLTSDDRRLLRVGFFCGLYAGIETCRSLFEISEISKGLAETDTSE